MTSVENNAAGAAMENFADLLAESFGENTNIEGSVVRGFVVGIEGDAVIIDVGLKSEGRVPMKELAAPGQDPNVNVGDEIEVYVERMEDRNGQAVLSRDKARREEAWGLLEASFEKQERVTGIIFGKVKGGFTVDGDIRPCKPAPLTNQLSSSQCSIETPSARIAPAVAMTSAPSSKP